MPLLGSNKAKLIAQADEIAQVLRRFAGGDLAGTLRSDGELNVHLAPAVHALQDQLVRQRSEIAALRSAVGDLLGAHAAGAVRASIDVEALAEPYRSLARDINRLAQTHVDRQFHVVDVVSKYAQGDLSAELERLPGELAAVNAAIDRTKAGFDELSARSAAMDEFTAALAKLTAQHDRGEIDTELAVEDFTGDYRRTAELLNALVRSHLDVQREIVRVVGRYAEGDFDAAIQRLPGKKAVITDALDRAKVAFETTAAATAQSERFVEALAEMKRQHELGWIDEVIGVDSFDGAYRRASDLVNRLVRAHIDVKMRVVEVVTRYAEGDFSVEMDRLPGKKATITQAIDRVRALLPKPEEIATMKRLQAALDNVSTSVMIADANNVICYMNPSARTLMREAERDLQKDLPQFRADALMSTKIDQFHKNPGYQTRLLAELRGAHKAEIIVGGRTLGLIANPVIDETGARIGAVVEWTDRTQQVAMERDTAAVVEAAAHGDFTKRLSLDGRTGSSKHFSETINRLMETSDVGLNEVVRVLAALAKGDLTQTIVADYHGTFGRLKDDSNATVESLTRTVVSIKEAADIVSTSSREIASGNTDLSQRTEEQAASLEETAASMGQLTQTVRKNAENAHQANELAQGASDIALAGGKVVGDVVDTMAAINESAKKIGEIISVIDGIAFQTNILALNAAVEAARAGEQGRGFAVVAGEVRNLAQRSAAAAKEIKMLISDSVEKTATGSRLVDKAGSTMSEIVSAVKRVTEIMAGIAVASASQGTDIEQVNAAINQMDQVTQQNAALVEEIAASAESLEERARVLVDLVSTFTWAQNRGPERPNGQAAAVPRAAHHPVKAAPARTKPHVAIPGRKVVAPAAESDGDWTSF